MATKRQLFTAYVQPNIKSPEDHRQEARLKKAESEAKLAAYKAQTAQYNMQSSPAYLQLMEQTMQVQGQKLAELSDTMERTKLTNAKDDLFTSYHNYKGTGDPREFNRVLATMRTDKGALGAMYPKIFGVLGTVQPTAPGFMQAYAAQPERVAEDARTPEFDAKLANNPELGRVYSTMSFPDGNRVANMDVVMGMIGYSDWEQRREQELQAHQMKFMQAEAQLANALKPRDSSQTDTALQRNAEEAARASLYAQGIENPTEDQFRAEYARQFQAGWTNDIGGTTPVKTAIANQKTAELYQTFGGSQEYFKTDFSDRTNRIMAAPLVREIERNSEFEVTSALRDDMTELRLAAQAARTSVENFNPEIIGFLDAPLSNLKSYLLSANNGDDTGTRFKSSYNTFKGALRFALSGASLTKSEQSFFETILPSLLKQPGPVLAALDVALIQLDSKLTGVGSTLPPELEHYYLGDIDIDAVRANLKAIRREISDKVPRANVPRPTQSPAPPAAGNQQGAPARPSIPTREPGDMPAPQSSAPLSRQDAMAQTAAEREARLRALLGGGAQ